MVAFRSRGLVKGQYLVLVGTVFVLAAGSIAAQESAQRSAKDVQVRIETKKQTYRAGEPFLVRLTLRNASAEPVEFFSFTPRMAVHLRVTDNAGRTLQSGKELARQWFNGVRLSFITLKGGEERILTYQGEEWTDLREWGYDLKAPGQYVITGSPRVYGPKLKQDITIRSNEATFSIEP